jgi:EAL domain-containing protein (putative c-di-GMP-specific phosphodiesterase class I)
VRASEALRVLLIEDELALLKAYGRVLSSIGYEVICAHDGIEGCQQLETGPIDIVLSDITMPRLDGIEVLRRVRARDADIPVILMTGAPHLETALRAIEHGVLRYLTKPFEIQTLMDTVNYAARTLKLARLRREALASRESPHPPEPTAPELPNEALPQLFDRALAQMNMLYQPIVSLATRAIAGFEALVRTGEPALRNPTAFLAAAEKLDRVHELGRHIREHTARSADQLPADTLLFVNLHPSDLLDDTLASKAAPLSRHARRVVLELTETARLEQDMSERTQLLRDLGFRLALDDLGSGYAGLNTFTQLEPEIVKIDMWLVREIHQQPTKRRVVNSIIQLCHQMNIRVVGEGVETVEERDVLAELGCDLLQGYLFAKPSPPFAAIRPESLPVTP